jgi:hypothetical protein
MKKKELILEIFKPGLKKIVLTILIWLFLNILSIFLLIFFLSFTSIVDIIFYYIISCLILFFYQNRKKLNNKLSISIAIISLLLILLWSSVYHDTCDFVPGLDTRGGDVIYSKSSLCLYDKAISTQNTNLCLKTGEYMRDYCIIDIAKNLKNESICNEITDWEYNRKECYKEVSTKLTIVDDALRLLSSNITAAVEKCQEFLSIDSQRSCYGNLSDKLSGLTYIERFNPSQQIVSLCLDSPNQKEWILCINGYAFDGFTASNFSSSFNEKVKSDPYKIQTFCDVYDYRFKNGGVYGPATELSNEVCK